MSAKILLFVCVFGSALSGFAQQDPRLDAKEELNRGVTAYRNANYEEAIGHFKNVVQWDPDLNVGHLYLATAYAQQYVPGVETPRTLGWQEMQWMNTARCCEGTQTILRQ